MAFMIYFSIFFARMAAIIAFLVSMLLCNMSLHLFASRNCPFFYPFRSGLGLKCAWINRMLSLGWEDPLEKELVTRSSILVWEIPWIE